MLSPTLSLCGLIHKIASHCLLDTKSSVNHLAYTIMVSLNINFNFNSMDDCHNYY